MGVAKKELQHLVWKRETRATSWSQTWEGSSPVSVWWPDLDPWGSARAQPERTRGVQEGYGEGLSVGLREVLANCLTTQVGKARLGSAVFSG